MLLKTMFDAVIGGIRRLTLASLRIAAALVVALVVSACFTAFVIHPLSADPYEAARICEMYRCIDGVPIRYD
jgi:hypothetical protein